MSSTRTVGRIAVAIGTGIAALAISLTAADIASARPPLCERGIDCPPPKPPPPGPGGQYQEPYRGNWDTDYSVCDDAGNYFECINSGPPWP